VTTAPLRLVLVEDSATQRAHLARVLQAGGDIVVVSEVADADAAVAAVARHRPDVVTMDLDLPGSGGQDGIARIMAETPTPILVLSGLIDGVGAARAVAALAAGAVDALPKPARWDEDAERMLRRQVRTVAAVPVVGRRRRRVAEPASMPARDRGAVVGIAASTGGPAALAAMLRALPVLPAPILLVQHIHPSFTDGFVHWLDAEVPAPVETATHGTQAMPGRVYVAPGEVHLRLGRRGRLALSPDPDCVHRPSANVLFESIADVAGSAGIGVSLTGMGDDGARGLLAMRGAGARTFGQDEASSVVFGMPRAAHRLGAVQRLLPPEQIAKAVAAALREPA
jgi:two-component system, chemotaxis family, protein-glutamate methylesterase/glutaminase